MASGSFIATVQQSGDDCYSYADLHTTTQVSTTCRVRASADAAVRIASGLRFEIPAGHLVPGTSPTITSAKIRGWIDSTYDNVASDIHVEAADDAAIFSSSRGPYHAADGIATVEWVQDNLGADGTQVETPDISALVQEYVDRAGYAGPGSYIGLFIFGNNQATSKQMRIKSWDKGTTQYYPQLLVSYTYTPATLAPGEATVDSFSDTSATVSWTDASGGTNPVTAQLQRSAHGADTWSDISGATTSPHTDTTVDAFTHYDYRVKYTDSAGTPEVVYSDSVECHTDDSWAEVSGGTTSPKQITGLTEKTSYEARVRYTDSDDPATVVYSYPLIFETNPSPTLEVRPQYGVASSMFRKFKQIVNRRR
jgi:hypothetical protein